MGSFEIKAPGKGADPRRFRDPYDRRQWEKLQALPNLIYIDGNEFSVWHDGELQHDEGKPGIMRLHDDIATAGDALTTPQTLISAIGSFLNWTPAAPRNARELARIFTEWTSVRKVKEGEVTAEIFGFLTCSPNREVAAVHPKAMPVILTRPEEWRQWLTAPAAEALVLQRPLPDGMLEIVLEGAREDAA